MSIHVPKSFKNIKVRIIMIDRLRFILYKKYVKYKPVFVAYSSLV